MARVCWNCRHSHYYPQGPTVATRASSPPWDIEDECAGPSSAIGGVGGLIGEDSEEGPPPLSQEKVVGVIVSDTAKPGIEVGHEGGTGGKATPSTLSDDAEDAGTVGSDAEKRQGRGSIGTKKRRNSKDGDSEEHEARDEGHDTKRKPRKSARLGQPVL